MDLSIVIINYKMSKLLEECLKSIFSRNFKCKFEVILVNKKSGDGTEEMVRDKFDKVKLVNHEDFGIAKSRNIGITGSKGRYVLMLDADAEVLDSSLDRMVEFMDTHKDAGCAGAKTLRPDNTLEYSCKRFYSLITIVFRRTHLNKLFPNNRFNRYHLMMDFNHDNVLEADWVAGACFLMRREVVEAIGLLDEKFFFGIEDVDWCYRIKRKGWKVYYIPDAKIVHHVQRTSASGFNRMTWEHFKSGLYYYRKHSIGREYLRRLLRGETSDVGEYKEQLLDDISEKQKTKADDKDVLEKVGKE